MLQMLSARAKRLRPLLPLFLFFLSSASTWVKFANAASFFTMNMTEENLETLLEAFPNLQKSPADPTVLEVEPPSLLDIPVFGGLHNDTILLAALVENGMHVYVGVYAL